MNEAVCTKKYLIKFQKLLKEGDCFIIRKPSLGDNMGRIIYVTSWDSYADKFPEYMADSGRPYVSTTYFATNLFINSDIDDINQFKSKLHCNDDQTTSSSYRVIGSSLVTSVEDDFLSKIALNTVIEVNDIAEVKKVFIVGTIKCVIPDVEWFKIPLRVQDSIGVLSLTLFDRDAKKLLNISAKDLLQKLTESEAEYNNLHPDEFNLLLDGKFAFKINISCFNLRNNIDSNMKFFGVSKITDDATILSTLENKIKNEEGSNTKIMHATSVEFSSQQIAHSKENDATTARTLHRNENSQHSFTAGLKRNLEDVYDVDDSPCQSISKSRKKLMADNEPDAVFSQKLLTPKIEK
ncbi:hypothetical protein E3N88_18527 [Mikania micrantha]|uniref:Replication factor A C-terminal domain-containing protein n=1 Tax=Mikania micrantha TaxID=192012 RepID=A0A5N6NKM9_9ASTR|nr:hypothetical protein E3N88_18527 [Mikania micrantha]